MKEDILTDSLLELEDYKTGYWFALICFFIACAWIVELKLSEPKLVKCFEEYCVIKRTK